MLKKDASDGLDGVGRYISSRLMVMEEFAQGEAFSIARFRALFDTRIEMCLRVMNLSHTTTGTKEQKMATPKTGVVLWSPRGGARGSKRTATLISILVEKSMEEPTLS